MIKWKIISLFKNKIPHPRRQKAIHKHENHMKAAKTENEEEEEITNHFGC